MEVTSLDQFAQKQHPPLYINPRTGGAAGLPQLVWLPPGYALTKEWRARYLENGVKRMKTFSARRHGMETGRQLAEVFLMEMQRTSRIPNDATCFKLVADWVASCSTTASSTTSSPISPAKSVESATQAETPSGSAEQQPCEPIQYPSNTLSENQPQSSSMSSLENNSVQSHPLYHPVQPEDFLLPSTTHSRLAAGSRKYLTLNHPHKHETFEDYSITLSGEGEESGKQSMSGGDVLTSMKNSSGVFRRRKIRKKRVRTALGQKDMLEFDLNSRDAFDPNVSGDDFGKEGRICTPVEMGGTVPEYQDEVTSRRYTEVVTRRGRKCRQLVGFASKTKGNIDVFDTDLLKGSSDWVSENCKEQSPTQEADADVCSSTGSTVSSVVEIAPGVVYDFMEDLKEDRPFPEGASNVLAFGESSEDDGDEKSKMRNKPRIIKLSAPDNMWLPHFHPHNQEWRVRYRYKGAIRLKTISCRQFGLEGARTFAMALVKRWVGSGRPLAKKTKRSKLSVLDINTSCQIISTLPCCPKSSTSSLPIYIERDEGNSPPQRRRLKHKSSLLISIQKAERNSPPQRRIQKTRDNLPPRRRFNSQSSQPIFLHKADGNSTPQRRLDSQSSLTTFLQKAEGNSPQNPQNLPVGLNQIRSSSSGNISGEENNHRGSALSSSSFLSVSLPSPNSSFSQSASSYFSSFASNILEADAAEKLAQSKVPDRCEEESVKNIFSASASFSSPFTCSGEGNSSSCEPKGHDVCCNDGDCTTLNRVRGTRGVNCETNDELGFLLL